MRRYVRHRGTGGRADRRVDPDNHVDEYQVELKRLLDEARTTGRASSHDQRHAW